MTDVEFRSGELVWLVGRPVTFVAYHKFHQPQSTAPRVGAAVVQAPGETSAREVPLWLLARDQEESVSRANAIPIQLKGWDID